MDQLQWEEQESSKEKTKQKTENDSKGKKRAESVETDGDVVHTGTRGKQEEVRLGLRTATGWRDKGEQRGPTASLGAAGKQGAEHKLQGTNCWAVLLVVSLEWLAKF